MDYFHILFVDDEPDTLFAIKRLLRNDRHIMHLAGNGAEALAVMSDTPIDILVTDMRMPEMDGLSLLRQVKERYPDTVRLALSAYLQIGQLLPCINSGEIFRYIIKPVQSADLKQALQDAEDLLLERKKHIAIVQELLEKNMQLEEALKNRMEMRRPLPLAVMDGGTGLYQRWMLPHFLTHAFERCKRFDVDLTCLMFVMHNLKRIRENHGLYFGKTLVKEFAGMIKQMISGTDLGFRFSDERFLILQPDTRLEIAINTGRRVLEFYRSTPFVYQGRSARVSIHLGAASFKRHAPQTPEKLIQLSDPDPVPAPES